MSMTTLRETEDNPNRTQVQGFGVDQRSIRTECETGDSSNKDNEHSNSSTLDFHH